LAQCYFGKLGKQSFSLVHSDTLRDRSPVMAQVCINPTNTQPNEQLRPHDHMPILAFRWHGKSIQALERRRSVGHLDRGCCVTAFIGQPDQLSGICECQETNVIFRN